MDNFESQLSINAKEVANIIFSGNLIWNTYDLIFVWNVVEMHFFNSYLPRYGVDRFDSLISTGSLSIFLWE